MSDFREKGPVLDYLLKEVSLSTCDNSFFGQLEKEMLVPNNINIYGKITGATSSLNDYELRLEFPGETEIAYIKQPSSNTIEAERRCNRLILSNHIHTVVNPSRSIAISHSPRGADQMRPRKTLTIHKQTIPYDPLRLAQGQTTQYQTDTKKIASPKNMTSLT